MIKLVAGEKGAGKTKELIADSNLTIQNAKGSIIFICDSNDVIYDLHHDVRLINITEFQVDSSNEFLGFLSGLISNNFDIEKIYIDGVTKIFQMSTGELEQWFKRIEQISEAHSIKFMITLNHDTELPETLKQFVQ